MTINAIDSLSSMAVTMNVKTAATDESKTELTAAEEKYDLDGDGVLSASERAAMLADQAKKSNTEVKSDSVSISQEALTIQN